MFIKICTPLDTHLFSRAYLDTLDRIRIPPTSEFLCNVLGEIVVDAIDLFLLQPFEQTDIERFG